MGYIGNQPNGAGNFTLKLFSGDNSTTAFTLDVTPASVYAVFAAISGVIQTPGVDFTLTGTTLTFTTAPATGTNNVVTWVSGVLPLAVPADGTVSTAKLVDGAVTAGKIDAADLATFGFTTGDVKMSLKTVADTGWVVMNDGTIGSASSGASTRANADCEDLYTLLWNNTANADCAVSGGRGASAAADWAANKTIALPKALGRALAAAGAGSGLTSRALASITGAETHTLSIAEMPSHDHTEYTAEGTGGGGSYGAAGYDGSLFSPRNNVSANGGGQAHNNMQPTLFLKVHIKL